MRFRDAEVACRSCQRLYPASDLDRYLWCPECRRAVRRLGARWGRGVGLAASIGVAAYVLIRYYLVLDVRPSQQLLPLYFLMLVITYVLTSRIAVAVVQGLYRARGGLEPPKAPDEAG